MEEQTDKAIKERKSNKLTATLRLYSILIKYWEDNKELYQEEGLCLACKKLFLLDIFTPKERESLDQNLFENKPRKGSYDHFLKHSSWKGEGFWFTLNESGYFQRAEFLKVRIEDLTKQLNTIQNAK